MSCALSQDTQPSGSFLPSTCSPDPACCLRIVTDSQPAPALPGQQMEQTGREELEKMEEEVTLSTSTYLCPHIRP